MNSKTASIHRLLSSLFQLLVLVLILSMFVLSAGAPSDGGGVQSPTPTPTPDGPSGFAPRSVSYMNT